MTDSADERIAEMLCRWAAAKYSLQDVTRVDFDVGQHGPYSDVTPDIDSYVEVRVWTAEIDSAYAEQIERNRTAGQRLRPGERWVRPHEFEESYSGGLIKDILRFALNGDATT